MANICDNTLYAYSEDKNNIEYISNYFKTNYPNESNIEEGEDMLDIYFESNWVFPKEDMNNMIKDLPNKDDIYIRCLSVEYGCLYHELWVYEGEEWYNV